MACCEPARQGSRTAGDKVMEVLALMAINLAVIVLIGYAILIVVALLAKWLL